MRTWLKSVLTLAPVLALALVRPVAAVGQEVRYQCTFTQECIGTERPCDKPQPIEAWLSFGADGWFLWGADEVFFSLQPVPGGSENFRSWLSPAADQDTEAVALLSIAGNGRAFLSIHGQFYAPETVLQVGTCTRKAPQ